MRRDPRWMDAAILLGAAVLFTVITVLAVRPG